MQTQARREKTEIVQWIQGQLAGILDISPSEIHPNESLMSYGLDSSTAVAMTERLSRWLGHDVEPTLLLDFPTIEQVAAALHFVES